MHLMQHSKQPTTERDKPGLGESSATIRGNDTRDDNYSYR